jgi:16S rRNA (cytidine1402-2'-O)-methyltransferase
MHEEIVRGHLGDLARHFSAGPAARGEMVLIIDRAEIISENEKDRSGISVAALVTKLENEDLDHRAALKRAARELGISRAEAYRRLVAERGQNKERGQARLPDPETL